MRTYDNRWLMASVASHLRRQALTGTWDGVSTKYNKAYLERCKAFHSSTGTMLIFSRDTGHHTSGWWKNPDYESCYHLSLSFRDPETENPCAHNIKLTKEWIELLFAGNARLLWAEPPCSDLGKKYDTWHYRLFCNKFWEPILPRKEVYSKDFTPAGWKSWSDVQAELEIKNA